VSQRSHYSKRIDSADQIPQLVSWVQSMALKGIQAAALQVDVRRPSKSRDQEQKYHAMINDIHQQCFRGYSSDGVKAVLVNQFSLEMTEMGEPLGNPGEKVWDWKSHEPVYVRPSTKKFRKAEAMAFIEFLFAAGAEYDVQWSEKALAIYDEMMEARAA